MLWKRGDAQPRGTLLIVPPPKLLLSSTTTIQRPTLNAQPFFYNLVSLCSTDSCTLQLILAITQVLRPIESMSGDTGSRHSKRPRRSSQRRDGGHRATSLSDACPSRFRLDQLRRHEEFWLDDGTTVLVAQDTAFRVYRGLLSSQSTVFQDMLAASNPDATEIFEGCPVVRLSDPPEELAHLMRAILPSKRRV